MMSSTQRFTFAWPIRSWICLSNIVQHRQRIGGCRRRRRKRDVPPRRTSSIAGVSALRRSTPAFSHQLRDRVGEQPGELWASLPTGEPWRLHARRRRSPSRARGRRSLADRLDGVASPWRSIASTPWAPARSSRSRTRSTPITWSAPRCCAIRVAMSRSARGRARERSAVRDRRVLDGLPRGRQHVGEEEEAVVGRPLRHLDRPVLRLRHAQVLGLAAGHLAVELRVAEQRRARFPGRVTCVVSHCEYSAEVAHQAVAAGDVERDHDAVAGLDVA